VPYGVATNMNTPSPGPGEEYPHINTQLFGIIDPPSNRGVPAGKMTAPYNAPPSSRQRPTMSGFVTDYISMLMAEQHLQPSYDQYAQVMSGYGPPQMPVTNGLARGFATYDHWFCEVPSQTFTNRSFFHAASSSGFLENLSPIDAFPLRNDAETIFDRLAQHGLDWRVYCDPPSHLSLTGVIHARRLWHHFATKFLSTDQFLQDCANGSLPAYSFIEPNLLYGHNDMHPAFDAQFPGADFDPPSSLLGGEALLAKIYNAIRSSRSEGGSNAWNTLLVVTFDEHGGTYDHVPPPLAPPPEPTASPGEFGFGFDRSGVRVPAIVISPWVPPQTVVSGQHRATSVIRTLRDHWQLGPPLTHRDAVAPDLAPVLSLASPRDPDQWPEVTPRPVPPYTGTVPAPGAALVGTAKAALLAAIALARSRGKTTPEVTKEVDIARGDGIALALDLLGDAFPRLH
jgi:phospholipase C